MMKSSQLRLGNYIEDIFNLEKTVKRQIDLEDLAMFINYGGVRLPFKPIELTEEILLKCHSIENRNTHPISYYLHNRIIFINDGLCYDYATRVKLPYLHTFQNFIFALTGKELEIKL